MNINEKMIQVAQDAFYGEEYEREMNPSEVRAELEHQAQYHIDQWLNTGDTEPLTWLLS